MFDDVNGGDQDTQPHHNIHQIFGKVFSTFHSIDDFVRYASYVESKCQPHSH